MTLPFSITTFGQDEGGKLYLADYTHGIVYEMTDAG